MDEAPIERVERVEPGPDQRGQRLGDGEVAEVAHRRVAAVALDELAVRDEHARRFYRVQRDSIGTRHDRLYRRIGQTWHEAGEELAHVRPGEWIEIDRREAALRRAPIRAAFQKVGSGERHDVDRTCAAPLQQVVDEIEQAGVGEVRVLEDEDDSPLFADALEERAPGSEHRVGRQPRFDAEQHQQRLLDPCALFRLGDPCRHGVRDFLARCRLVVRLEQAGTAADHLTQSPEADAFAIGGRSAVVPVGRLGEAVDVLEELPREPRLAYSCRTDDRHQPRLLLAAGRMEKLLQEAQLVGTTHEGRFQPFAPLAPTNLGDDADRAPRRNGRLLALEYLLAGFLEGDRGTRRAIRRLADQHGARWRHGLEPRRRVHDVPGDHALVGRAKGHGRLAGEDPGACCDLRTECADRVDQLERGANGALDVILVRRWSAPDGHDRVADVLLDDTSITLDDLRAQLEVARQRLANVFGIALLGERREADDVGKQNRYEAPFGDGLG